MKVADASAPMKRSASVVQGTVSALDQYKIVRSQIEHEDNLVSQRLSWFVAFQSFLFTAYAISLAAPVQVRSQRLAHQQELLVVLIPLVALCTGVLLWVTIGAGLMAMRRLRAFVSQEDFGGGVPPIQGSKYTLFLGHAGPTLVPGLFAGIWLLILVKSLAG